MINFNYSAPAELFGSPGRQRRAVTYRRFTTGAEAVRFAVEGQSDALFSGTTLQADDDRFDHRAIRALYDSEKYPLPRQRGRAKEEAVHVVQLDTGVKPSARMGAGQVASART